MALDIWDEVTLSVASQPPRLALGPEERQYRDLVLLAATRCYDEIGVKSPELHVTSMRDIPLGRGLGSSAAAIVAACVAANSLAGAPLDLRALGDLCSKIEGHPDNSTPCLFGGFQVCALAAGQLLHQSVPIPEGLRCVLFIPDFPLPTHETRKLLPEHLSRSDVVFQTSRAALLVAAISAGALEHLREATQDRLHQPARGQVFTGMQVLFEAALEAGALCVYLSGGGPTVLALDRGDGRGIRGALEAAARAHHIGGETRVVLPSAEGAHVVPSPSTGEG